MMLRGANFAKSRQVGRALLASLEPDTCMLLEWRVRRFRQEVKSAAASLLLAIYVTAFDINNLFDIGKANLLGLDPPDVEPV